MISIPWNPFPSVRWLSVSSTRMRHCQGRGWSFVLCVLSAWPREGTRQACVEWTGHLLFVGEQLFPMEPLRAWGPEVPGPTFALGASMLHALGVAPTLGRVGWAGSLLGMCPVILAGPWAEQGPCSLALPWSLSSRGWSPPPPLSDCPLLVTATRWPRPESGPLHPHQSPFS